LEDMRVDKDEGVQKVRVEGLDVSTQLRNTIVALRDELDGIKFDYEDRLQEQGRISHDEIKQLKETISALRNELEIKNGK
jgi:hypothetical protein